MTSCKCYYQAQDSDPEISISNEYLSLYVECGESDGIGTVTLKTSEGYDLLFSSRDHNAWSSYLTVQVDGINYVTKPFAHSMNSYVIQSPTIVDNSIITKWKLPNDIIVTQEIKLIGRAAKFVISIKNGGSIKRSIKIRYLFDYEVKDQDGAPIYIEGKGVLTKETKYIGMEINFDRWFTRDYHDSTYTFQGVHILGITRPYMIIFANWYKAYDYIFDYTEFDPNRRFYTPGEIYSPKSDSCALIYWDLGEVAANDVKEIYTYYGIGEPEEELSIERLKTALESYYSATMRSFDLYVDELSMMYAITYRTLKDIGEKDTLDGILKVLGWGAGILSEGAIVSVPAKAMIECVKWWIDKYNRDQILKLHTNFKYIYEYLERNKPNAPVEDLASTIHMLLMDSERGLEVLEYDPYERKWLNTSRRLAEIKRNLEATYNKLIQSLTATLPADYPIRDIINSIYLTRDQIIRSRNGETTLTWVNPKNKNIEFSKIGTTAQILTTIYKLHNTIQRTRQSFRSMGISFAAGVTILKFLLAVKTVGISAAIELAGVFFAVYAPFEMASKVVEITDDRFMGISNVVGMLSFCMDISKLYSSFDCNIAFIDSSIKNTVEWINSMGKGEIVRVTIPDIILPEGRDIGISSGSILVRNTGTTDVRVNIHVDIYGPTGYGKPVISMSGIPESVSVAGGEERNIEFRYGAPGMKMFDSCEHYTAEVWASFGWNAVVKKEGITFKVGSEDACNAASMQNIRTVIGGELAQGQYMEGTYSTSSSAARVEFNLFFRGSDFDIHLYDSQGRHVGINYETGEIEVNIPGAVYSGPAAYPEWIIVNQTGAQVLRVKVVATSAPQREGFKVIAMESPRYPALMGVIPSAIPIKTSKGRTVNFTFVVNEYGGYSGIQDIEVSASDLKKDGATIPASNIKFVIPSTTIPPSSSMFLYGSLRIPANIPSGTYNGFIRIRSNVSESQICLNVTITINGDVNHDGIVDYGDLAIIVYRYGFRRGDDKYLEDADVNADDIIDYRDLAIVISNYEKS
ncbi:MAG: hypothetical protein QXX41_14735 [Nitrososphaerota archaeon]